MGCDSDYEKLGVARTIDDAEGKTPDDASSCSLVRRGATLRERLKQEIYEARSLFRQKRLAELRQFHDLIGHKGLL